MRTFRKNLLLLLSVFSLSVCAQEKTLSLKDCIELAFKNNIQSKQIETSIAFNKASEKNKYGEFLPAINANIRNSWNQGLTQNFTTGLLERTTRRNSTYNLFANMTVFNGFKNWHEIQLNKLNDLKLKYELGNFQDGLRLDIVNTYLQILAQEESERIIDVQYKSTLQQIEDFQEQVNLGQKAGADILDLKSVAVDNLQRKINVSRDIKQLYRRLNNLISPDQHIDIKVDLPKDLVDDGFLNDNTNTQSILDRNNELNLASQNIIVSEKQYKIDKLAIVPTVSVFSNLDTRESEISNLNFRNQLDDNYGISYGVQIDIPILNKLRNRGRLITRKAEIENLELEKRKVSQKVSNNISEIQIDITSNYKLLKNREEALRVKKNSYENAKQKLKEGLISVLDFNQVKLDFENAQLVVVQAEYEYYLAILLYKTYLNSLRS